MPASRIPSPWPPATPAPTTLPLPQLTHWLCWQSFGNAAGFDECDAHAVILVSGLPTGTRQIRVECHHALRYVASRALTGTSATLGIREQAATTRQWVAVHGEPTIVSVNAYVGVRTAGETPTHFWSAPVRCDVLGIRSN
ncbi:MAG: hypothetical protein KDG55_00805 [Rhodocyclaceae bacterium]|nr:hypothetical protein [Rhodocyclaceae bacterium]